MANNHTISEFKDKFNGGTRANRFTVDINWPAVGGNAPDTHLYHVIAAKLPESELGSISVPYRGRIAHFAGDRDYKPWTVTIIDDTGDNGMWHAFHNWSNKLSAHDTNTAEDQTYAASSSGANKYLLDLTFKQLHDPTSGSSSTTPFTKIREITLHHAWPSEVGQIGLDMGEGGSLVTFTVTFTYDYYEITYGL